jgi:hypothetical protein
VGCIGGASEAEAYHLHSTLIVIVLKDDCSFQSLTWWLGRQVLTHVPISSNVSRESSLTRLFILYTAVLLIRKDCYETWKTMTGRFRPRVDVCVWRGATFDGQGSNRMGYGMRR